jgi:hypothetical protein
VKLLHLLRVVVERATKAWWKKTMYPLQMPMIVVVMTMMMIRAVTMMIKMISTKRCAGFSLE